MEKVMTETPWLNVAEVELVYKTKVKASERPYISHSKDTANLLRNLWDQDKIDFVEQMNLLLLNRANRVLGIVNISTRGRNRYRSRPEVNFSISFKSKCLWNNHCT